MSEQSSNLLYQAACSWKELTKYRYVLTYGYKKELHTVNLVFFEEDFPHLAGFQYLKDLPLPKFTPRKTMQRILDGKIPYSQVSAGMAFATSVMPRLQALIQLKDVLEGDFRLFLYLPRNYSFSTMIKADYLISSHLDCGSFVFVIKVNSDNKENRDYLCCSAFAKGERNFEERQRILTILKKERVYIPTESSTVLFNRLSEGGLEDLNPFSQ